MVVEKKRININQAKMSQKEYQNSILNTSRETYVSIFIYLCLLFPDGQNIYRIDAHI